VGSRLIESSERFDKLEPMMAVAAFNAAFATVSKELIHWAVGMT